MTRHSLFPIPHSPPADVLIIGAGPAGSIAATLLARGGLDVRLIDKKPFPRRKVCGTCLSGYAIAGLQAANLAHVLPENNAAALSSFRLASAGHSATLPLRAGCVLSRTALDAALADEAVRAGATFYDNTTADLGPLDGDTRLVSLHTTTPADAPMKGATGSSPASAITDRHGWRGPSEAWPRTSDPPVSQAFSEPRVPLAPPVPIVSRQGSSDLTQAGATGSASAVIGEPTRAKVVVIAAGLSGVALRHDPDLRSTPTNGSRIGAGAETPDAPDFYTPGTIFMATHRAGYVGLVRTETGALNVAAALDPRFVTAEGGLGLASAAIVRHAGFPDEGLAELDWTGTPPLTRRPAALAANRVFLIGDAAGYVEPFTGEGIGWAIGSAAAVVPFALRAIDAWSPTLAADWTATYQRTIARRQRLCRLLARALRSPATMSAATRLLAPFPRAATPLLRHLATT